MVLFNVMFPSYFATRLIAPKTMNASEHCVIITSLQELLCPRASPCGLTAHCCHRTILSNHTTSSSVNVFRKFNRTSRRKILTSSFRFLSFPHFVFSFHYFFSFFHCSFIGKLKKKKSSTNMADTFYSTKRVDTK